VQWSGRLTHKIAGNYRNLYDGKVYNSGFKEYDGNLFLGMNKKWGHTHLHLSSFNNVLNLPEGERDSSGAFIYTDRDGNEKTAGSKELNGYQTGFPHQRVNHLRIASNNYFILPKGTLNADLAYQQNKRREFADVMNPDDIALFFDLHTFNYNIRYHLTERNNWETSIGAGGMQQSNHNKGIEFLIPEYRLFDAGIYLLTQKTIQDQWILSGGVRFDSRNMKSDQLILDTLGKPVATQDATTQMKFSPLSTTYYGLSGSAGLSWLLSSTATFKFNLSRGYRAPGIAELASNGRHEGTFRYEVGNASLRPEISHQIDVAFFKNAEHLTLEITPFVNFISHYIYAEKMVDSSGNDIIIDPADPAPAYRFVQGNARLTGTEIYLDFHPHPLDWLHIEQSFSFVKGLLSQQSDSTKYLPMIPAPKYKVELKAAFKSAGKFLSNVYIKAGCDYYFKQNNIYSAYGTETATAAYLLVNAGVGAYLKALKKKDRLAVFISGDNLTNISYQSHLSRLKYAPENRASGRTGVFNMGRNISLKLIWNL
jgi:iron complex outermembrane receptor protein